jgi:hypothetical protein
MLMLMFSRFEVMEYDVVFCFQSGLMTRDSDERNTVRRSTGTYIISQLGPRE